MSPPDRASAGRLQGSEPVKALLDVSTEDLRQLLESMCGQAFQVRWEAAGGSAAEVGLGPDAGVLWWQQPFPFTADATLWVGAPQPTWSHVTTLMLEAAGLESAAEAEASKTWQEILAQWLSMLARRIGAAVGQDVVCAGGCEHAPAEDLSDWALVTPSVGDRALPPLAVAFSAALLGQLAAPPQVAPAAGDEPAPAAPHEVQPSRTMELLLDVELPVSISFGKAELPLKDVLKLTTGSIVELNRGVSEPVEILVNGSLIARGEVVVIEGNYGVRIERIVSRLERLRSLH